MLVPQRRLLNVLLHNVGVSLLSVLWLVNNLDVLLMIILLGGIAGCSSRGCLRVHLGSVVVLFSFQVVFVFLCSLFEAGVYLLLEVFQLLGYEDSSALTACFWLADEHHGGVCC